MSIPGESHAMRDRVRLTVGLPVYNGEQFLREAVDSILCQTFVDFELVISDNASTDPTEEICRAYAERDSRVRYLRSSANRGAAWNHNRVVEVARGSLFKWASADDVYRPQFLARCVEALGSDRDAVLAYPRTIAVDEGGQELYRYSPGWELRFDVPQERLRVVILKGGHWINADAVSGVIRTEALRRTRLLPRYQGGDKRPLGELSLMGKFLEVPEYLLLRRFHRRASSRNNPHATQYDRRATEWMTEFFKGSAFSVALPSWSLMWDHLVTAWSSQLSLAQKLRMSGVVVRACRWHQSYLVEELRNARRIALLRQ
jgi:glycosyltransferase involved in cell wall biosynthesis